MTIFSLSPTREPTDSTLICLPTTWLPEGSQPITITSFAHRYYNYCRTCVQKPMRGSVQRKHRISNTWMSRQAIYQPTGKQLWISSSTSILRTGPDKVADKQRLELLLKVADQFHYPSQFAHDQHWYKGLFNVLSRNRLTLTRPLNIAPAGTPSICDAQYFNACPDSTAKNTGYEVTPQTEHASPTSKGTDSFDMCLVYKIAFHTKSKDDS